MAAAIPLAQQSGVICEGGDSSSCTSSVTCVRADGDAQPAAYDAFAQFRAAARDAADKLPASLGASAGGSFVPPIQTFSNQAVASIGSQGMTALEHAQTLPTKSVDASECSNRTRSRSPPQVRSTMFNEVVTPTVLSPAPPSSSSRAYNSFPVASAHPLPQWNVPQVAQPTDLPLASARPLQEAVPQNTPSVAVGEMMLMVPGPMGFMPTVPGPMFLAPMNGYGSALMGTAQPVGHGTEAPTVSYSSAQFYALAQLAEETAQMNALAAALCASKSATPVQIAMISEAAQKAAQRAAWAVSAMLALEGQLQNATQDGISTEWIATMKQITSQAADAADQASQSCKTQAEAVGGTNLQAMLTPKKSKVPCKNHLAGHCAKGINCEFSHDPADLQARPLMLKSMKPCMFFAKGHCMRGPACPFAHGDNERVEIEKYVDQLKKEKKQPVGNVRRQ